MGLFPINNRKFVLLFIFGLMVFTFSCKNYSKEKKLSQQEIIYKEYAYNTYLQINQDNKLKDEGIKNFVSSLDLEEKIAQLFLVNLEGNKSFYPVEFDLEKKPIIPGGYLFFSYNIASSPSEVQSFTKSIMQYCIDNNYLPPILTLDQEGGVVNRLRGITSPLPSAQLIASRMDKENATKLYSFQAEQMNSLGFHMNLAPVAEICDVSNYEFLGNRSYGDIKSVKLFASGAVQGFQRQKILSVVKHFPGNTNVDPHTGLPEISLPWDELEKQYLQVFQSILNYGPKAVLMSHVRTSAQDAETPACLSKFWINDILREKYDYSGLIISDDIFMAALEKNGFPPEKAVVMAVEAGVDLIMLSEKRFYDSLLILKEKALMDSSFMQKIDTSVKRIIEAKVNVGLFNFIKTESGYKIEPAELKENSIEKFNVAFSEGLKLYNQFFGANK